MSLSLSLSLSLSATLYVHCGTEFVSALPCTAEPIAPALAAARAASCSACSWRPELWLTRNHTLLGAHLVKVL